MGKFFIGKLKGHSIIINGSLNNPLCFTAQQANSTVQLNGKWSTSGSSNPYDPYVGSDIPKFEYKLEGSTNKDWSRYTGQKITLANVNDKMYMRATSEGNKAISGAGNYYTFVMTGKIAASGNIQTLLDQTGNRMNVPNWCYSYMFQYCTSLTTAPELPATTLGYSFYQGMFYGCTSLTTAPELPATTLGYSCYAEMFWNCTSLTKAPELPATNLDNTCYSNMFWNCPKFSTVKMKSSMNGVYNIPTHGDIGKTVEYVL